MSHVHSQPFNNTLNCVTSARSTTHRKQRPPHKHDAHARIQQRQRLWLVHHDDVEAMQRGVRPSVTLRPERHPQPERFKLVHHISSSAWVPWRDKGEEVGNGPLWV